MNNAAGTVAGETPFEWRRQSRSLSMTRAWTTGSVPRRAASEAGTSPAGPHRCSRLAQSVSWRIASGLGRDRITAVVVCSGSLVTGTCYGGPSDGVQALAIVAPHMGSLAVEGFEQSDREVTRSCISPPVSGSNG